MKLGRELLYLCNADIEGLGLGPNEVRGAVERMFAAKADGSATMKPKTSMHAPGGTAFLASSGVLGDPPVSGIKWVAAADNAGKDLPHIAGSILLADNQTGMPLALMDAAWVTGVRTAAITAVAARHLARADSAHVGFIACGLQARTHLAALRALFPLRSIRAYSRRLASAEAFAAEARAAGLEALAVAEPEQAVAGMDIVVTTTPVVPRTPAFLDADWLVPGAFVASVDLGISWHPEPLARLDRVVTDDLAQAESERLTFPGRYAGEIADLVVGRIQGRAGPNERTGLIFAGIGLADVAVAALVHGRAVERGVGRVLPL